MYLGIDETAYSDDEPMSDGTEFSRAGR